MNQPLNISSTVRKLTLNYSAIFLTQLLNAAVVGVLTLLFLFLTIHAAFAQIESQEFVISGYVAVQKLGEENTKSTNEADLFLLRNDTIVARPLISKSGAFTVKLQPGHDYILKCEKPGYATKNVAFTLNNVRSEQIDKTNKYFDLTISMLEKDFLTAEVIEDAGFSTVYWDEFYEGLTYSELELKKHWEKIDSLGKEYVKAVNSLQSKRMSEQIASFKEGITWPQSVGDTVDISIYKNYPLFVHLVKERKSNPVMLNTSVSYLNNPFTPNSLKSSRLEILYADEQSGYTGQELLTMIGNNVLLVTGNLAFDQAMINFRTSGNQVDFEVNEVELAKRGFNVSEPIMLMANITSDKSEWQKALTNAQVTIKEEKLKVTELEAQHQDLAMKNEHLVGMQQVLDSMLKVKNRKIDSFSNGIQYAELRLATLNTELEDRNYSIESAQKALRNKQKWLDKTSDDLKLREVELANFDSVLSQTTKQIAQAQLELGETSDLLHAQKRYNRMIGLVLLAISVLLYFVYRGYRRQKLLTEEVKFKSKKIDMQREQLEQKNMEMSDSISYAKRIQEAMLPSQTMVQKHFDQSFILYEPKDIVAGDFFWMKQLNDDIYFAVADCTGHGVPGAMMSVLCSNALDRALREAEFAVPSELLSLTRKYVIGQIAMGDGDVMDGMDIALCSFNKHSNTLQFAGAHNPIWIVTERVIEGRNMIVTNLKDSGKYLYEIKGDKQPVGKFSASTSFSNHSIQLHEGDTIYIFSDGFSDQFGGKRGKKMKQSLFKELIGVVQDQQDLEMQKEFLSEYFVNWKGDLEQVDDVCVMGVKL